MLPFDHGFTLKYWKYVKEVLNTEFFQMVNYTLKINNYTKVTDMKPITLILSPL